MKFAHTFWLFGLTAAFAFPIAQSHCAGTAQTQTSVSPTKTGPVIDATSKPVGIPITGVN